MALNLVFGRKRARESRVKWQQLIWLEHNKYNRLRCMWLRETVKCFIFTSIFCNNKKNTHPLELFDSSLNIETINNQQTLYSLIVFHSKYTWNDMSRTRADSALNWLMSLVNANKQWQIINWTQHTFHMLSSELQTSTKNKPQLFKSIANSAHNLNWNTKLFNELIYIFFRRSTLCFDVIFFRVQNKRLTGSNRCGKAAYCIFHCLYT